MAETSSRIVGFCCNYTGRVDEGILRDTGLASEGVTIEYLPCTGKLEVTAILSALEAGAEAVFVAGCDEGTCHNISGSRMAGKRVGHVKEILGELDMDPSRVEMFYVQRGEIEPVVLAAREMARRVGRLEKA